VHVEAVAVKARSMASAISRLMPNIGGAGQRKRKLLSTVVASELLYSSPIWAGALVFNRMVENLVRPQRMIALRIVRAYRTVSTGTVLAIAGLIPAHLLCWERDEKYKYTNRMHQGYRAKSTQRLWANGRRNGTTEEMDDGRGG